MFSILVANSKGGCGKSTLTTNLAGYYANMGRKVMLVDADRQQSAMHWLQQRPEEAVGITGLTCNLSDDLTIPRTAEVAVIDAPAGLHGKKLAGLLMQVDRVVVPVQPSPFDIVSSNQFIEVLAEHKRIRKGKASIGFVGMRVDPRTHAAQELARFLQGYDFPVLAWIRGSQLYVQLAARGLTLFDLPVSRAGRHLEDWQGLIDWLEAAELQ